VRRNIEVVKAICRILAEGLKREPGEFQKEIKHIRDPRGAAHDFRYSLECTKMKELGWSPAISFEDGLARTVDWYLASRDWVEGVISGEYRERVYGKG